MSIKKHLHVNELDCPKCAEIIIESLEAFDFIQEVNINYDTKDIIITSNEELTEEQTQMVLKACLLEGHCADHEFNHLQDVVTEEYHFEDIDCANCAAKVERALNKDEDILNAKVNFINKKIIITHMNNVEVYDVVSKIVGRVEHGATISKIEEDNDHDHGHDHHEHHHHHHHHHECECDKCSIDHDHEHEELNIIKNKKLKKIIRLILLIIGVICFLTAHILEQFDVEGTEIIRIVLALVGYVFIGYDIIIKAVLSIIHGDIFNENTLMLLASVGALSIKEFFEGTMVLLLYKIGEFFQDRATENSKNAIKQLMEIRVDTVMLSNGTVKNVKEVNVGEIISIRVGERIPLDGVIKTGDTSLDMKTLTGESMPTYVSEGEEILSGSINLSKVIEVEVTKKDSESTLTKVRKLVEEANNKKSKTEQFITKFARIYTPVILLIAVIVFLVQFLIVKEGIVDTLNNVFTILVISCPCALVISIPLAYFAGIGACSANGILVKGGNYLEALNKAEYFAFDKTGTITKGNFKVSEVNPLNGMSKDEMIEIVAKAEQYSLHPIAKSIEECYGKPINDENLLAEEYSGAGVKVKIDNKVVLVGNENLMNQFNIEFNKTNAIGTILYLAIDNLYYGYIVISDEIKAEAKDVITALNVKEIITIMLTGDKEEVANNIASKANFKEYKAKLLPEDKYNYLKELKDKKDGNVIYVGDGINDAPALTLADVGIAMGGVGSDSAKECADIVIMNDDLNKINKAMDISKFTRKIIIENVTFILLIKVAALLVGAIPALSLGKFGMIFAIFADVGVCLLAILNVLRIMKFKKNK
ncbi:MAG: cadmium-translocating P-type ATPase [Bacilli bacterium]|nr:cadmium-translocating P-type ATPase [Bacilli bacterium]